MPPAPGRIYEIPSARDSRCPGLGRSCWPKTVAEAHFARIPANEFLEVLFRSGRRRCCTRATSPAGGDRRRGGTGQEPGVAPSDCRRIATRASHGRTCPALEREHSENDLFPSGISPDWMKLTDFDPENVAARSDPAGGAKSAACDGGGSPKAGLKSVLCIPSRDDVVPLVSSYAPAGDQPRAIKLSMACCAGRSTRSCSGSPVRERPSRWPM